MTVLAGCTGNPPPIAVLPTAATASPTSGSTSSIAGTTTTSPAAPVSTATQIALTTTGSGDDPQRTVLRTEEEAPRTRTDEILAALSTGAPTVQLAIDAFDVSIADLPGATQSALPDGDGLPPGQVMELINSARGSLTAAQVAIIDEYTAGEQIAVLDVPGGAPGGPSAPSTAGGSMTPTTAGTSAPTTTTTAGTTAPSTTTASETTPTTSQGLRGMLGWAAAAPSEVKLRALLQQTINDWLAYRPAVVNTYAQVVLEKLTKQPKGKNLRDALMYVDPAFIAAHPTQCRISVTPLALGGAHSDFYYQVIFAHELFHCHQARVNLRSPAWVVEGSADFASYDLYRSRAPAERQYELFDEWWSIPKKPLAKSTYDAWPLYDIYRERTGGDPYPAIDAMLAVGGTDPATILAAGGMDGQVYSLMIQSTSSRAATAPDALWRYTWPGRSTEYGPHDNEIKYPAQGVGLLEIDSMPHFSHAASRVPFTGQVVMVELRPSHGDLLTIAQSRTVSLGEGQRTWFCLQPSMCRCPENTEPKFDWTMAQPKLTFAMSFQDASTSVDADARKWDEKTFCTEQPQKPVRSGHSDGDPHLQTFDGLSYDAMQLGEFVTTQDIGGGFTVQERHEPATFGTAVTSLAMSDGEHRVTVTLPTLQADPVIEVDGNAEVATTFTDGGISGVNTSTEDAAQEWTFTWPDGSQVAAHIKLGINVSVSPAEARLSRLEGLLGTPDGTFLDDLTSPRGGLDNLDAFQEQWLVTSSSSLFDYEPGQSAETFRTAPRPTLVPIKQEALDACTASLGEDATSVEIRSCAFDVSATGNGDYTQVYQQVVEDRQQEEALQDPDTPLPDPTTPSSTSPGAPGRQGSAALTVDGVVEPPGSYSSDLVEGSVEVVAGTVVVLRASCPTDAELDLGADLQIGETHSSLFLCGPNVRLQTYDQQGDDVVPPGEAYALMTESGTLTISLDTASQVQVAASVEVFVDPEPQEIHGPDVPTTGQKITLDGIADTVVVWMSTGAGESVDWTVTGAPKSLCRKIYYVGRDSPDPMLGSVCGQQADFGLTPDTAELPFVFFQRADGTAELTLTRVPK